MELEIGRMRAEDVSWAAELEKVCFQDPWSEKMLLDELENPLSIWLAARDGGTGVGYIGSQTVLDESCVMNLAVFPGYRRKGAGRALMRKLEDILSEKGSSVLLLEVRPSNTAAVRLYQSEGFVQAGRRKNYYLHPREDALILRKELKHEHSGL